jgi:hypothetical protein
VYGDVVSVQAKLPFTENSTFAIPTLSEALAAMDTVEFLGTVAPSAGLVMLTVGGTVSAGPGVAVGVGVRVVTAVGVTVGVDEAAVLKRSLRSVALAALRGAATPKISASVLSREL